MHRPTEFARIIKTTHREEINMRVITALIACAFIAFALPAEARGKGGSRPSYSGSKHTSSHGGHYSGGSGSSHKGGSYRNSGSGDRYGKHGR